MLQIKTENQLYFTTFGFCFISGDGIAEKYKASNSNDNGNNDETLLRVPSFLGHPLGSSCAY